VECSLDTLLGRRALRQAIWGEPAITISAATDKTS